MTNRPTAQELQEIRERHKGWCKFAWTQPRTVGRPRPRAFGWWRVCAEDSGDELAFTVNAELAAAITKMQPDVLALLAEVDALTTELKVVREAGAKVVDAFDTRAFTCNTSGDDDAEWAVKLSPYLVALATTKEPSRR